MSGQDLRKETRIPSNNLPGEYTEFSILLPHGLEATVITADASLNGFGFFSDLSADNFIQGTRLVLYPLGNSHAVYGDIVHTAPTVNGTRVGVRLLHLGGYEQYHTVMKTFLDRFQESISEK